MATVTETVDSTIASAWRIHVTAIVATLVLLVVAFVEQERVSKDLEVSQNRLQQLKSAQGSAGAVLIQLRQYLLDDYHTTGDQNIAVMALLRDVANARDELDAVSDATFNYTSASYRLLVDFNHSKNKLENLLNLNASSYGGPADDSEVHLPKVETGLGAFQWGLRLEERSYDELARLLYYASIRPSALQKLVTSNEARSGYTADRLNEIRLRIERHAQTISGEKSARNTAKRLWDELIAINKDAGGFGLQVGAISPNLALAALSRQLSDIDKYKNYLAGQETVTIPGVGIPIQLKETIKWFPYAIAVLFVIVGALLLRAANLLADRGSDDRLSTAALFVLPTDRGLKDDPMLSALSFLTLAAPMAGYVGIVYSGGTDLGWGTAALLASFAYCVRARWKFSQAI